VSAGPFNKLFPKAGLIGHIRKIVGAPASHRLYITGGKKGNDSHWSKINDIEINNLALKGEVCWF